MNKLSRAVAILILPVTPTRAHDCGGVPVIKITQEGSSIKIAVKASVPIEGVFDKWDATLAFSSADAEAGVLEVKIQADSGNSSTILRAGWCHVRKRSVF